MLTWQAFFRLISMKTKVKKSEAKKDWAASYNRFKTYKGQFYTGAKVGRAQKWYYDKGEWKEHKVTPDKWEFNYAVTKRRAGKAPEGSGVPVGTEYHWYILAHQNVKKLDANSYTTSMTGIKYKIAHKRADHEKWNITDAGQRKRLLKVLHEFIEELEQQPEENQVVKTGATEKKPSRLKRKKKTLPERELVEA
jgi:hypothetical protein